MKVFAVRYTDCIHESGMMVQSLHKTHEGALLGLNKNKALSKENYQLYLDFLASSADFTPDKEWDEEKGCGYEAWDIKEMEVEE